MLERAWNSLETNQFGTNEFIEWCRLVGTEPLLGFDLGTGTPEQAVAYVEYCNLDKGTRWGDLRREHGHEAPHNVRYWCLGNEMNLDMERQIRETLTGTDLNASNTFECPTLVAPRPLEPPRPGAHMTFRLPARSYSVVHMATS